MNIGNCIGVYDHNPTKDNKVILLSLFVNNQNLDATVSLKQRNRWMNEMGWIGMVDWLIKSD